MFPAPPPEAAPEAAGRLDPRARPFVRALSAFFPDLGGAVTDAAEARRILAAVPPSAAPPPEVGSVADRMVPGPPGAPPVPVRIYRPDPLRWPGPRPTVVFTHGGGFVLCDLDTYDATVRTLCRTAGAVVVSVDYRRAPEHRFPAAVLDAHAALCWAGAHLGDLGGHPGALVVAGDSAGGNLAAAALLHAAGAGRGGPRVALQALVYPTLDAARTGDSHRRNAEGFYLTATHLRWFWEQYLGPGADGADPLASPLNAAPELLAGLPPAHVVVAGCDPLADDGVAYHRLLQANGVPSVLDLHPGMFHGFLALSPVLPAAAQAMERLGGAIASMANDGKTFGGAGGGAE
ncbi:alpha/beta hydrolase [Streptomyces sp. NPDC090022]|uniref:alpha/beta hydrolase n=1 Tax=Streptomyces sp. NPDC090022 TaxID=3365920 RepID=UPI003820AE4F